MDPSGKGPAESKLEIRLYIRDPEVWWEEGRREGGESREHHPSVTICCGFSVMAFAFCQKTVSFAGCVFSLLSLKVYKYPLNAVTFILYKSRQRMHWGRQR